MNVVQKAIRKTVSDGPTSLLSAASQSVDHKLSRSLPQYIYTKRKIHARLEGYRAIPDPTRKLNIPVQKINLYRSRGYSSEQEYWEEGGYWKAEDPYNFNKWSDLGAFYNGEWDVKNLDLTQLPKYVGMKEHFVHGIAWERTSLFDYYRELLAEGITIDGCNSEKELLKRYNEIEEMCEEIRLEGYKSREEICNEDDFMCLMDEVTVSIGRNGQFIFGDGGGWHRLCAAKIFDIETIPVRVLVRHTDWQEVRELVNNTATVDELDESLRVHLSHPDIKDCL